MSHPAVVHPSGFSPQSLWVAIRGEQASEASEPVAQLN
jgi:hypothetical protein